LSRSRSWSWTTVEELADVGVIPEALAVPSLSLAVQFMIACRSARQLESWRGTTTSTLHESKLRRAAAEALCGELLEHGHRRILLLAVCRKTVGPASEENEGDKERISAQLRPQAR